MRLILFSSILCLSLHPIQSWSQSNPTGLSQTQETLRNPTKRSAAIKEGGEQAVKADQFIDQAFGNDSATKQSVYDLAAEVMKTLEERGDQDPEKMNKILLEAAKNPQAFLKSLPTAQKNKVRDIAEQVEQKKSAQP